MFRNKMSRSGALRGEVLNGEVLRRTSRSSRAAGPVRSSIVVGRWSRRLTLITAVLATVALSGCAAGQISQTAQEVAAIDGGNATVGDIGVRNALLATPAGPNYAQGSNVSLLVLLANTGIGADTLTAVSTPAAGRVTLPGSGVPLPGQTNVTVGGEGGTAITLTGLTRALCYGQSIPLTFSFQKAGRLTLNVPIEVPTSRTGTRETIEIQAAHPTPLWELGGAASSQPPSPTEPQSAASVAGQSAGPATACNNTSG